MISTWISHFSTLKPENITAGQALGNADQLQLGCKQLYDDQKVLLPCIAPQNVVTGRWLEPTLSEPQRRYKMCTSTDIRIRRIYAICCNPPPIAGPGVLLHIGGHTPGGQLRRMTEFAFQASALARKCAKQQLRAVKTNICLLVTPILFCMTLWVLQHVVTQLILQNSSFQVEHSWEEGQLHTLPYHFQGTL